MPSTTTDGAEKPNLVASLKTFKSHLETVPGGKDGEMIKEALKILDRLIDVKDDHLRGNLLTMGTKSDLYTLQFALLHLETVKPEVKETPSVVHINNWIGELLTPQMWPMPYNGPDKQRLFRR